MRNLCTDIDLLKYEDGLFGGDLFTQFVLCRGINASITGSYLSANNVDFISSQVGEGNVIFVRDDVNSWQGVYEVVQCVLAGQVQISVLRSGDDVLPVVNATGLRFCVVSFKPIIYEVSFAIARYFGLSPANGCARYSVDDIADLAALRQAATLGCLSRIYAIMPYGADQTRNRRIFEKYEYYRKQYRIALENSCVAIDTGTGGRADVLLRGGETALKRI